MLETLIVIFTGVSAISTALYTYLTLKLWKSTRRSADIAALSTLMSLIMPLADAVEKAKQAGDPNAGLAEHYLNTVAEMTLKRLLGSRSIKDEPEVSSLVSEIAGVLRAKGVDPAAIPVLRMFLRQLDE